MNGNKINEYRDENKIKKGDVVIRKFYYINFWGVNISVHFSKFKHYAIYGNNYSYTPELKKGIRMRNSVFNFNNVKKRILNLFSRDVGIEI